MCPPTDFCCFPHVDDPGWNDDQSFGNRQRCLYGKWLAICPSPALCPAGTYSVEGKGMDGPGGKACRPCDAGKYESNNGSSVCANCVAGTYSKTAGASSQSVCTDCMAGTYSPTPGAFPQSVCTDTLYSSVTQFYACLCMHYDIIRHRVGVKPSPICAKS
jgi:hypothetical protein